MFQTSVNCRDARFITLRAGTRGCTTSRSRSSGTPPFLHVVRVVKTLMHADRPVADVITQVAVLAPVDARGALAAESLATRRGVYDATGS
jgi:hypothetical protein